MGFLIGSILTLILLAGTDFSYEVTDVSVGEAHGCAIYDNGSVWCWGAYPGKVAEVPYVAKRVQNLPYATSIASGRFGSCAVDLENNLWCWGVDYQRSLRANELLLSTIPFLVEGLPPVIQSDLGYDHQCALSIEGEVWCWGGNTGGELGVGDTEMYSEPIKVLYVTSAVSMSTGVNNTCVILDRGSLSCWGTDNPTSKDEPFIYNSSEPLIFSVENFGEFSDVANGRNFGCGLRTDGKVTCWGSNILGQLGSEALRLPEGPSGIGEVDNITNASDLDAGYFHACAVQRGEVICWGVFESTTPRLPYSVPGITNATRVGTGGLFNCAVDDRKVVCWGDAEIDGVSVIEDMGANKPALVPGLPD